MSSRLRFRPMDWMVLIMVLTGCVALLVSIGIPLFFHEEVSELREKLIHSTLAAMLSVISMYIGAKIQGQREKED